MDGDFDLATEAGEGVHQAVDGEGVEAVVGEGGDFGLVDAEMAGGAGLGEAAGGEKSKRDFITRKGRDEAAVLTAQPDTFAGGNLKRKSAGLLRSK